jgi:putative toxin-antitoxin system antitoxin component (TIGR02293 family)
MISAAAKSFEAFATLSPGQAHEAIVKGVPIRDLHTFVSTWGLSQTEASKVLSVGVRTYQRLIKTPQSALDTATGGRFYRAANIMQKATDVLGSADDARIWLRSEQPALNYRKPLDMMETEAGAMAVERLLGRIEYGVFT